MKRQPGAIFIVDPHRERIAVTEANKLEIPVVGTGDTNVDPDELDFIIPANDDAIRSIRLLCQLVADAAIEGAQLRAARSSEPEVAEQAGPDEEPEFDEAAAADLVAQLAAGGTLSFDPESDDDELLPGAPKAGRGGRRRPRPPRHAAAEYPSGSGAAAAGPGTARIPRRPRRDPAHHPEPTRAPPRRAAHHDRRSTHDGGDHGRGRQAAARADRRRLHGLQARARGGRRRRRQGRRARCARRASPPPQKKAGREAREGLVSSYIHPGGRLGVLIEVNCETDFVARTDEFQKLVKDLAMQVAGPRPDCTSTPTRSRPTSSRRRRPTLLADPATAGKPAEVREKIVQGQLAKWYKEVCLLDQPFRDEERAVRDLVTEKIATIGENIRVRRFTRYALGEEL